MDVTGVGFVRARDAIKLSRSLLHGICATASVCSFLLWVIPPFASQSSFLRKSSWTAGILFCGTGLICASKLKHHESLFRALDLAEREAFNFCLAQEVFSVQQLYGDHAHLPQIEATDVAVFSAGEEITTTSTTKAFPASLIEEVGKYVSNGSSDTYIIENVLQCRGRKFGEGKAKLAEIKSLISASDN